VRFVGFKVDKCQNYFVNVYCSDGLAVAGNAPRIFKKTNRNGLPYPAIIFCAVFALLAYMGINSGSGKVFQWFSNMTSVAG
jgi:amino acid transporter